MLKGYKHFLKLLLNKLLPFYLIQGYMKVCRMWNLCYKNTDYMQWICVYESLVQIKTYYKKSILFHDVEHFCKNIHNVEWIEVVWSGSWLTDNVAPLDDRADIAPVTFVQVKTSWNLSAGARIRISASSLPTRPMSP